MHTIIKVLKSIIRDWRFCGEIREHGHQYHVYFLSLHPASSCSFRQQLHRHLQQELFHLLLRLEFIAEQLFHWQPGKLLVWVAEHWEDFFREATQVLVVVVVVRLIINFYECYFFI